MQVTLYSRAGCHLCDEARAVLHAERARTPFELVEVEEEIPAEGTAPSS